MNIVVLKGTLSRAPEERDLPSGSIVLGYEVTVAGPDDRAESVPVAWTDPPAAGRGLVAGAEVVVVGRVRRRFFRAGGVPQSRTEVVAEAVLKPSQRQRVATAVARVQQQLGDHRFDRPREHGAGVRTYGGRRLPSRATRRSVGEGHG